MAHPVWVRGLKRIATEDELKPHCVAPRVGAWIETSHARDRLDVLTVAPRVGAWIETLSFAKDTKAGTMSHPVWVRGLKLLTYI